MKTINLTVNVRQSDFDADHGRCALEVALIREHWIVDAFTGFTAIDVLSESGKVARFKPGPTAWAAMRKSDRGDRPDKTLIVPLEGVIIGRLPDFSTLRK